MLLAVFWNMQGMNACTKTATPAKSKASAKLSAHTICW